MDNDLSNLGPYGVKFLSLSEAGEYMSKRRCYKTVLRFIERGELGVTLGAIHDGERYYTCVPWIESFEAAIQERLKRLREFVVRDDELDYAIASIRLELPDPPKVRPKMQDTKKDRSRKHYNDVIPLLRKWSRKGVPRDVMAERLNAEGMTLEGGEPWDSVGVQEVIDLFAELNDKALQDFINYAARKMAKCDQRGDQIQR